MRLRPVSQLKEEKSGYNFLKGRKMKKQIANFVTFCRILGSIGLLCSPVFSAGFYGLYLFCGLTDMVDGTIARKTGAASTFGARLDSVADFLFAAVSFGKLLPVIRISWGWVAAIGVVKLINLFWGFLRRKQIPSLHTIMNKVSGLCLFLLPLTTAFVELQYTAPVVCAVSTIAAIQEGYYMATGCNMI